MEEKNWENKEEEKFGDIDDPKEAEVSLEESNENEPTPEEIARKKKRDFRIEMVLILILGILIGIAVKTEAVKSITMGYEDYKMKLMKQDYNLNQLQRDVLRKQEEAAKKLEEPDGGQNGQIEN